MDQVSVMQPQRVYLVVVWRHIFFFFFLSGWFWFLGSVEGSIVKRDQLV